MQIASQAGGVRLRVVPDEVARRAAGRFARAQTAGGEDELLFDAMRRWMVDKDPAFLQ